MADEGQAAIVAPRRLNVNWHQFMSLLIQALEPFGYEDSLEFMECDLPQNLQPMKLAHLRSEFLGGFYEKCAETLCKLNGLTHQDVSNAMVYIVSLWYLERAAQQDWYLTVTFVSNMRRLLREDQDEMKRLISDIASSLVDLTDFCVFLELRKDMLRRLELALPSPIPNLHWKLLKLIKYGINAQIDCCLSHNKEVNPLYCDHLCSENHLPTKTIQILTGHHEEVRCVKFSHNGLYLASGSLDCTAIIWKVEAGWEFINKHVLRGHREAICSVSWSPNDELLLTCAPREHIKMWYVRTGQCIRVISQEEQVLSSCVFLKSDPIEIVYGKAKRSGSIRLLSNGTDYELVSFPRRVRGRWEVDLAVTQIAGERKVIYYDSVDQQGKFTIFDIRTSGFRSFMEGVAICGISVSEDGQSLILNLINNEIHVWNLWRLMDRPLIYWNFKQICDGNTPCFGGVMSRFLVTGTQDAKVCIWNRKQARPIAVLSGHTSAVRCVSWNPKLPQMLASASDDKTIRIWGPKSQAVPLSFRHG